MHLRKNGRSRKINWGTMEQYTPYSSQQQALVDWHKPNLYGGQQQQALPRIQLMQSFRFLVAVLVIINPMHRLMQTNNSELLLVNSCHQRSILRAKYPQLQALRVLSQIRQVKSCNPLRWPWDDSPLVEVLVPVPFKEQDQYTVIKQAN